MLKIRKKIDYKQETEVVKDTTSKTRPDTWRSVADWVDRLTDWSDIYVDDTEDIMDKYKVDTAYQDKLELAQTAQDLEESLSNRPAPTSSPAEHKEDEETPKADDDGEVKPASTDEKSSDD